MAFQIILKTWQKLKFPKLAIYKSSEIFCVRLELDFPAELLYFVSVLVDAVEVYQVLGAINADPIPRLVVEMSRQEDKE
jgi:hypothetical protein